MTQPAYQTRAESDPRAQLVEVMCPAFYEAEKQPGSSLPPWPDAEPTYQAAVRRGIVAALTAAERAGWRVSR